MTLQRCTIPNGQCCYHAACTRGTILYAELISCCLKQKKHQLNLTQCLPLQRGSTSEAQAVGLYYEQRFKWVDLVWQLLQSALASPAVQAEEVTAVIASTVRRLLQQQQPGQATVVARLLESIKVCKTALPCCEGLSGMLRVGQSATRH